MLERRAVTGSSRDCLALECSLSELLTTVRHLLYARGRSAWTKDHRQPLVSLGSNSTGGASPLDFEKDPKQTGGVFSIGYLVTRDDGREGFLKALDYSKAMRAKDPAVVLQSMTTAFLFERDILDRCESRGMDRVVRSLDSGTVTLPDEPYPVQCGAAPSV